MTNKRNRLNPACRYCKYPNGNEDENGGEVNPLPSFPLHFVAKVGFEPTPWWFTATGTQPALFAGSGRTSRTSFQAYEARVLPLHHHRSSDKWN